LITIINNIKKKTTKRINNLESHAFHSDNKSKSFTSRIYNACVRVDAKNYTDISSREVIFLNEINSSGDENYNIEMYGMTKAHRHWHLAQSAAKSTAERLRKSSFPGR